MDKEQMKETAIIIKNGLVTCLKLLLLIVASFLKAITLNFFQNVKAGWETTLKKPEVKEKKKAVKEEAAEKK